MVCRAQCVAKDEIAALWARTASYPHVARTLAALRRDVAGARSPISLTISQHIAKRFVKKRQMRWMPRGLRAVPSYSFGGSEI